MQIDIKVYSICMSKFYVCSFIYLRARLRRHAKSYKIVLRVSITSFNEIKIELKSLVSNKHTNKEEPILIIFLTLTIEFEF